MKDTNPNQSPTGPESNRGRITRSTFIRTAAMGGVAAALLPAFASGQSSSAPVAQNDWPVPDDWTLLPKVDVHNHLVPADYLSQLHSLGIYTSGGHPISPWTPSGAVQEMAQVGVSFAFLSLSAPNVYFGPTYPTVDENSAIEWARKVNTEGAAAVVVYPHKFGYFACLPTPFVQAAIDEAEYALGTLKADGIIMMSSSPSSVAGAPDIYLGDPSLDPLMEVLDSYSATVFVHPNQSSTVPGLGLSYPSFIMEFPFDTSRAAVNMLLHGVTARFPKIKFILAHGGGVIPYLAGRLTVLADFPGFSTYYPKGPIAAMQQFYVDTASASFLWPQKSLESLIPKSQILLGTDMGFAPLQSVQQSVTGLADPNVLPPDYRSDVAFRNAVALFPRIKSILRP